MEFFEDLKSAHFIGVGGIGMSGLARLFMANGVKVIGSDIQRSDTVNELEEEGVEIHIGHEDIIESVDLVVYSEAIPKDNAQLEAARLRNIPAMNYFEALGKVTEEYQLLAVAGTHGKTTTTAMLGLILIEAGLDPTVLVGSKLKEFDGKNIRIGSSDLFVVEACEYRRNFMSLYPELLGIVNIELDHVDYFKGEDDYKMAFVELSEHAEEVIWPLDVHPYQGELGVPGEHSRWNAGLAALMAQHLEVSDDVIERALSQYKGAWRRFELKGECNGALVYDDYAHHPTEIRATLQAAREKHLDARVVAVFQPHQYSRTAQFLGDFAQAFEDADQVIIPNIYEARDGELDKKLASTETLVAEIAKYHEDVLDGEGLKKTAETLKASLQEGDIVLVMGAGDVTQLADELVS